MHILTVLDHPNPHSFSAAIARSFMSGAQSADHTTELADLHAEGFSPIWSAADANPETHANSSRDIKAEQRRIERADAICLVFPLYWWGMPAMMKGWVDRVWSWGWAYDQLDDPDTSLQRPRSGLLLVPAGARSDEIEANGHRAAMETAWIDGTFGYFGLSPRRLELLCGSTGSNTRRADLLNRAFEAGRSMTPATSPATHRG
ncbi:NAD(P)H-dependent oxidoreductase [Thalassobius sp. Cn5-15]|uniref:NAD(P)H-dependent oxidoreductase n=1 Tax=Thalassobius sp. Cn5-15 TaxID=2917763 RepID=UPI001EF27F3F|nr:NAD(P)H-dependent oxidoreductase [Thalassobius sp. Cn5-15]MCG7493754.1 NAD(P)H-dependent oxidoreductase [Thalassobius sp. Cn5-15]